MQRLKNEKGITLIALVITAMVLSIISVPVVVNVTNIIQFNEYADFKNDIDILRESISAAYFDKSIDTIGPKYEGSLTFLSNTQNGKMVKNTNDNNVYYAINVDEVNENLSVEMTKLKNGSGNKKIGYSSGTYSGTNDVYIINQQSRTIYYVQGVTYNGETYYRLNEDFTETESGVTPGTIVADFNKVYTDIYGAKAKIPVGYMVSTNPDEQIVSKGLVILDGNGNEFVWIPVQEFEGEGEKNISITFDRYVFETQAYGGLDESYDCVKIKNTSNDNDYYYEAKESFEVLSVIENKGFYIGRYETGTTASRTSGSQETAQNIKKGLDVYNYVTRDQAVTLADKFKDDTYVKSKLCSSYAWDTVLKFIERTGNESYLTTSATGNSTSKTGIKGVNNIFDLDGNVYEWTTELSSNETNMYTVRGGASSTTDCPITRNSKSNTSSADVGYRITLFLNNN